LSVYIILYKQPLFKGKNSVLKLANLFKTYVIYFLYLDVENEKLGVLPENVRDGM